MLVGAEAVDGIAVERILDGKNHAGGGADARDFFDDDGVADVVHARAAFVFGDGDAGEAEFGGFLEQGAGEVAGFVDFFGERLYFGFGEFADAFLQELLFFGEFEVHALLRCGIQWRTEVRRYKIRVATSRGDARSSATDCRRNCIASALSGPRALRSFS